MTVSLPEAPVPGTPPQAPPTTAPRGLDWPRRFAFASPDVGLALFFVSLNSWLLYFLINVVELPPALAGVAFLIGRLFDAVLDPIVGRWSDRTRPRMGRMPPIRWALLPAGLLYVAMWVLPVSVAGTAAAFVLATLGFMAFSFAFTLLAIPRHALLPDLVPDYDARTQQVSLNMVFVFVAVFAAIAVTPGLVIALSGVEELAATPAWAWVAVAGMVALVASVAFVPFLRAIPDVTGGEAAAPAGFARELRTLFATPGYGRILLIFLLTVLATLTVQAMTPFYLESYLGVPGPAQPPILGGIFALSILSFPLWGWLGTRWGKARGLLAGIGIYCVFLALVPFMPREGVTPVFVVACLFAGLGVSAINLFPWAMLPDAVDMDAATHGHPREGLVYAVFAFTQKTAGSIAVFWNAIMLAVFDHRAGQAVQSEETLAAFVWMTGPVPLLVLLVAGLIALRYPITREAQAAARNARGTRHA